MTSQARYWILTIPAHEFTPYLPPTVAYLTGQLENSESGYVHWQLLAAFKTKVRLRGVKAIFGAQCHAEATRSEAAEEYCGKEETRVDGTPFTLGTRLLKRGDSKDWEAIRDSAKRGKLDDIPADVYVRNYNSLRRICTDHMEPVGIERTVHVFWGVTGTGKSRTAWREASMQAYPKDPNTKFWDGYRNHANVVIDEFRGLINISNLLRWFDRYPVNVEIKGGSVVLCATSIWITSNLHPSAWFPELDAATNDALMRRLTVREFKLGEVNE
ncbi:replication associated protein [Antarctic virus COCH21_47]|uniref:Replication-associated protein n=1 Tax=Antarctic virus COCH21_47 TaxID=2664242 RepID=A0A5Q2F0A7_9VIRU|nr:replication associated protein [Antarctic virus COCH21_47]